MAAAVALVLDGFDDGSDWEQAWDQLGYITTVLLGVLLAPATAAGAIYSIIEQVVNFVWMIFGPGIDPLGLANDKIQTLFCFRYGNHMNMVV